MFTIKFINFIQGAEHSKVYSATSFGVRRDMAIQPQYNPVVLFNNASESFAVEVDGECYVTNEHGKTIEVVKCIDGTYPVAIDAASQYPGAILASNLQVGS